MRREEIVSFLREFKNGYGDRYGIVSLGVFGSVARDEMRDESDADIYVKTRAPEPFMIVHRL